MKGNVNIRQLGTTPLDKRAFYTAQLRVSSAIFHILSDIYLTEKEIELLVEFLLLKNDVVDMFSTYNKKIVREKLKMSSSLMSNYLGALTKKGVLSDEYGTKVLVDFLKLDTDSDILFSFRLKLDTDDNRESGDNGTILPDTTGQVQGKVHGEAGETDDTTLSQNGQDALEEGKLPDNTHQVLG